MILKTFIKIIFFISFNFSKSNFENLRFTALPADIQSIKSDEQIKNHLNKVKTFYQSVPKFHVLETNNSNIFMYLNKSTLAAYIQIENNKCFNQKEKREIPYLNVYCVTVTDDYRGLGLSTKLFVEAIDYMTKRYSLPKETMIALHLSPNDMMMPVAANIYYKLGFIKGVISKYGPSEYSYKIEDLLKNAKDLFYLIDNPEMIVGDGYYFLSYCKLEDFNKKYSLPENSFEKTKKMFDILKERQNNYK